MRTLRLAIAQLNPTVGDLDGNAAKVADGIRRAREAGADLLAVPEMTIPGYPPEDLLLKPSFIERAMEVTRALAPLTGGMTVLVGTLERDVDLHNAAAVLHDGRWVATYRKRFLPNYGVFDENRYFMPARENPVFVRDGAVIGISICEDIWYPGGPVEEQVLRGGAELLVNLSASPYHAGKADERRRMLATRSTDHVAVVAYANLVGGQDEVVFDGASLVIDEQGAVLAEGERFAEDFLVVDLDLSGVFGARLHEPRLRKGRVEDAGAPAPRVTLPPIAAAPEPRAPLAPRPARATREPIAEIYDALVLGVRDYVRKNGFHTVALGLSGGVDSALTACVAADAIGGAEVVGVSMPSGYTSGASRADAEALARALGMRFYTLPIGDVFDAYQRALAAPFLGREPDVTEENLQARIRGNYLMALSNKFGWLVLTTGNKSEIAVGYNTLYGDTAGGYAVLKDVYKTQVYELARHRNARGPGAPIPEYTLTRPPSAELRPGQTDQDSLPPYDTLDPILRWYLEEDRSVAEIAALGYDADLVARVARMVDASEYKRRQAPPGVKITPRAFGKDRRMPITNGWKDWAARAAAGTIAKT
jgi:NAD+ synthase (glutamine-hydrolysing)